MAFYGGSDYRAWCGGSGRRMKTPTVADGSNVWAFTKRPKSHML